MPKIQETSKETQETKASPQMPEQYYGPQRRGLMEIIFNIDVALFFILIFLLLLWIGIIFGLAGGSLYYQIGKILYSLGGIFLFFFILGISILNNSLHTNIRISLIALAIVLFVVTLYFP